MIRRPWSQALVRRVAFLRVCLTTILLAGGAFGQNAGDDAIRFLEERTQGDPDDFVALNKLAERYLQKLRESGDLAWLRKARRTAEASVASMPERNPGGLAALARTQLASHRFEEAAQIARKLLALQPNESFAYAILGDVLVESGDVEEARKAYGEMQQREPDSVQTHSRIARLAMLAGDWDAARDHLDHALAAATQFAPPVPEMIAWCEVQRGELAFSRGDWAAAAKDYDAALTAFPDYFAALDHIAELYGARGEFDQAIALYQKLNERVGRPEYQQAIGDLFVAAGKPEEAKPWHERALAAFTQSVADGEVLFIHHLANFFTDVREDAAEAIKFARRDLELRQNSAAHEMLAWALFRNGDFAGAAAEMEKALAHGGLNAHLAYHAGMIFSAAGDFERGQKLLKETTAINPRYHAFHVHR